MGFLLVLIAIYSIRGHLPHLRERGQSARLTKAIGGCLAETQILLFQSQDGSGKE
jgi:hypothetical protein